jgi:glutamine cyclotransferase
MLLIKIRKTFAFTKDIEGWEWLMTENIFTNQTEQKNLDNKPWKSRNAGLYKRLLETKIKSINELEYIKGKIYVNVWQKMQL